MDILQRLKQDNIYGVLSSLPTPRFLRQCLPHLWKLWNDDAHGDGGKSNRYEEEDFRCLQNRKKII